jgi:hypothetical protein
MRLAVHRSQQPRRSQKAAFTDYRELAGSSSDSDRADQSPDSTWHQMSRRGVIIIFDVQAEAAPV